MAEIRAGVKAAIGELRDHFSQLPLHVFPSTCGGAHVVIEDVPLGSPSQKVRDAVRTFAARAIRGRRLAYGLIFEPIDPEVESTRLKCKHRLNSTLRG